MTPVVNPWLFYWMPVCEKVSLMAWIALGCCLVGLIVAFGVYLNDADYFDEEDLAKFKRCVKTIVIFTVITVILACLVPSEETITKMLIAQNVTVERVDVAFDTVVNVYNDIMNLFRDSGAANG